MKARPRPEKFDETVPAHLAPFVDVLGEERAIEFLLEFGGATYYLAADPKGNSEIERAYGDDGRRIIDMLKNRYMTTVVRIPIPKTWIAGRLRMRGLPISAIARRLHVTDSWVRRHLPREDDGQLRLI